LPQDVQDTIEAIMVVNKPEKKDEKWIRFHLLRMFGIPTQTASSMVGFTPSYGYKLLKRYRNDTKLRHTLEQFVSQMPDDYRTLCRLRLPDVAEIEQAAIQEYKNDPKLAIRQPQLLKQVKQAGGVDLNESVMPTPRTISIEQINIALYGTSTPPTTKTIEAEVINQN